MSTLRIWAIAPFGRSRKAISAQAMAHGLGREWNGEEHGIF
jgi:hypothetical protein